ncbi:MAG: M4 family metallopeptidase [Segetibacter sp.]
MSAYSYDKEPGAINESMSDIMGKSVQFYAKPCGQQLGVK